MVVDVGEGELEHLENELVAFVDQVAFHLL